MSKCLIVAHARAAIPAVADDTTRYFPIAGCIVSNVGEAAAEQLVRDAGTFSQLQVRVTANDLSNNATATLRKSLAGTSVVVTITASTTGLFTDTSNSASFANTDECALEVSAPAEAGSHAVSITWISLQFEPASASDGVTFVAVGVGSSLSTASVTQFISANGTTVLQTTEANAALTVRASLVAQDLSFNVSLNTRSTTTTFTSRKNGATGGQSVSYAASATGVTEDTSGTDTLTSGDTYNYAITTGTGTGTIGYARGGSTLVAAGGEFVLAASPSVGMAVAFNTTVYPGISGCLAAFTTETTQNVGPPFSVLVSKLDAYVSANTIATSATTVTVRDNLADSAITVSVGAGATGLFSDASNTTLVLVSDEMNYEVSTPNTSGSITLQSVSTVGLLADVTASGTPSLAPLTAAGVAQQVFSASGSPSLAALTVAGAGQQVFSASGSPSLAVLTAAGAAEQVFTASGAATLAALTAAGTAEQVFSASGAMTLAPLTAAGEGTTFAGSGAVTLAALTAAGVSEQVFSATGAPALAPIVAAGAAEQVFSASGSPALAPLTAAGTGEQVFSASGAPALAALTAAGVAQEVFTASGAPALAPATCAGVGFIVVDVTASGALVLAPLTATGAGELVLALGCTAAAARTMRLRWAAQVETPESLPTIYDNEGEVPVTSGTWARFAIQWAESRAVSFGRVPRHRHPGAIRASVHTPMESGDARAREIADVATSAFREVDDGSVTFRTPYVSAVRRDEAWWRMDVTVPFEVDCE